MFVRLVTGELRCNLFRRVGGPKATWRKSHL